MFDKTEFYHGAAILRVIQDLRSFSIKKKENLGYIVNERIFIFLKFSTRGRSPWGFTFDQEDVDRCVNMENEYSLVALGLICGGDGICTLRWNEAKFLLAGKPGRIAASRNYNKSYSVRGSAGKLKKKISSKRWPSLIFEKND